MKDYEFTLLVEGVPESDEGFDAFANAIFEFDSDCVPGISRIAFGRTGDSLRAAIRSAVDCVHRAAPAVTVVGVILHDGQPIDDLLGTAAA
jgi:hypothetical protein